MPPFDISDLFTMRRQPDQHTPSELDPSRDSDKSRRRRHRIDAKEQRRHSSGRDFWLDSNWGHKDANDGIHRSATISHQSREKDGLFREEDKASDVVKEEQGTATSTIETPTNEDRDYGRRIIEEKKFSWGSFRMSRLRKKHASTDTQKHEYGEHRLEDRMRWSTQLPSLEIIPPPSSIESNSSADRFHLPAIDVTISSATINALSQLEGGRRENSVTQHPMEQGRQRSRRPKRDKSLPSPPSLGRFDPSKIQKGSKGLELDETTRNRYHGDTMLSPIVSAPGSPESLRESRKIHATERSTQLGDKNISRLTPGPGQQPMREPSTNLGLEKNGTSDLRRSYSAQESSVLLLRRIPQRLHTTGSMGLQANQIPRTEVAARSPRHYRHNAKYGDDVSIMISSQTKQKPLSRDTAAANYIGESRNHPHHVASATTLGRSLTATDLLQDAQVSHLPLTERPHSFARSTVNSIASAESKLEQRFSTGRSTLYSELNVPSPSLMSLPTTTSGSGMLGPTPYRYLALSDMEYRLVRVLPERMSTLKCEICHRSLHDTSDYIAISYAWGDGLDMKQLVLEGTKVLVPTSLYDALKAVRKKKEGVLVWVDALCIDQRNRDERATQVRLMGEIYSRAVSVAIWLGPEADESAQAVRLLQQVANNTVSPRRIRSVLTYPDSAALLALFKRDYWKRLWVVQEVLLGKKKMVYCGHSVLPWEVYQTAADAFWDKDSDPHIRQGPASFPDMSGLVQLGENSLLEIMRACRKKLSENPRDKVFGVLGLVPEVTEHQFPVDYSQSVKTVHTDVVDYLISTTDQIDVIRESIHFPVHANTAGLPTWCPDWSHIPGVSGLGRNLGFHASGSSKAQYHFHDKRRKLEISGIRLDVIKATGVAVGTFCSSQDYLTAFLHWRAMLLHELKIEAGDDSHPQHQAFCRTLCLGQVPADRSQHPPQTWQDICYHVFSSLIRDKMPRLPMEEDLGRCANASTMIKPDARRKFLQDHFGDRMMGRSFCITEHGLIGMGSGYMTVGDLVIVPFGCSTPILLRSEGRRDEFRYVGDVYVDGYMHGEAIQQTEDGDINRVVSKYMLC